MSIDPTEFYTTVPLVPTEAQPVPVVTATPPAPAPAPPVPEPAPVVSEAPAPVAIAVVSDVWPRYHRVTGADSLPKIAAIVYGSPLAAAFLYAANRDVIGSDPDRLQTGTILTLPAPPAQAAPPAPGQG